MQSGGGSWEKEWAAASGRGPGSVDKRGAGQVGE